jgi:hypothetical protein
VVTLPVADTNSCGHARDVLPAVVWSSSILIWVEDARLPRIEPDAQIHGVDLPCETADAEHCAEEDASANADADGAQGCELGRPLKNVAAPLLLMRSTPRTLTGSW